MFDDPLLATHLQLLQTWRTSMNLVGPGPVEVHFEDSRAAVRTLGTVSGTWADLGTGAGFPGVVFAAVHPHTNVQLVDSRRKRCVFLRQVVHGANRSGSLEVVCSRIEALAAGAYDGLMARALAPPPKVLEMARRLLKPGGRLLLLCAQDVSLTDPAFHVEQVTDYEVGGLEHRALVFRKRPADSTSL